MTGLLEHLIVSNIKAGKTPAETKALCVAYGYSTSINTIYSVYAQHGQGECYMCFHFGPVHEVHGMHICRDEESCNERLYGDDVKEATHD